MCASSQKDPDRIKDKASRFIMECEDFCRRYDMAISTLSQKALSGTKAIQRMPSMASRMDERIQRVRMVMAEIAAKKLTENDQD